VPATEFLFQLTLSGEAPDDEMLTDIMKSVLARVGLHAGDVDRLLRELRAQHWASPPGTGCNLRLLRQGDEIQVVVSQQGREWRIACAIPS